MKNFFVLIVAIAVIIAGCVVTNSTMMTGDFFEGTGQGYRGPITVQVYMNGGSISGIIIADSAEDPFVGGAAIEELIDIVLEYDTTDVDVISGATQSSKGFLDAVRNAIH